MNGISAFMVVGAGGFAGANARYLLSKAALQAWGPAFPYGTLIINVLGCFLLGLFATLAERLAWSDSWRLLVAVGFLGAFTTFSTFEYETVQLAAAGNLLRAAANVAGSVAAGFVGVMLGIGLARLLLRGHA